MGRKKKKEKLGEDEKRSVIANRGLLLRVLRYCFPYKKAIFAAVMISIVSSMLGAVSLLAMIPVLQLVMDRSVVAAAEDRGWEIRDEARTRRDEIGDALDTGGEALDQMGVRYPGIERVSAWVAERKGKAKAEIYGYLDEQEFNAVVIIAGILLLATALKAFLEYRTNFLLTKVLFRGLQKMKIELYAAVLFLDMGTFQDRSSGNLLARLSGDVAKISTVLKSILGQSFSTPFTFVALFCVLLFISWQVTLITIVALPLIAVPIMVITKKVRRLAKRDAEEDAYLVDVMQETLQGLMIVRAFGAEHHERHRFSDVAKGQVERQIRRVRWSLSGPAVVEVLSMAAICLVIIAGGFVVLQVGRMDPAEFIVYLVALQRFYKPIKQFSQGYMRVQRGLASAERVFEIMDEKPRILEKPGAPALAPIAREIRLQGVTFGYGGERENVLKGIDLVIPRGATVALVGETGSGKSTVAKLLPRFFDPTGGAILVDDVDIRDVTVASLRSQISIVTQETILFDLTILENISYGKRDATREEVEEAARKANIHDFILTLPNGYDTRVGERGGQLSGGQRQRLAIARALLRDAPILILDEATSALDNETEASIQRELDSLMSDRTVVVIAHRLSTIRGADQIVVLHRGEIVEQGTHEELMARGARYAAMTQAESVESRRAAENPRPAQEPAGDEDDDDEDEDFGLGGLDPSPAS